MARLVGIDEAGFGPVLGPLVVSSASFTVPDESVDESMWRMLAGAVSRKLSKRRTLIAYADSKKLYSGLRGKDGLRHLERGVLSMLAAAGHAPKSLAEFLTCVAPAAAETAGRYPWYDGEDLPLPREIDAAGVMLTGKSLATRMAAAGIGPCTLRCEPIFAGEYNRLVAGTRNKSTLLLDVTSRLLVAAWDSVDAGAVCVHVDRQGGRTRYLPVLQRLLPGCSFRVLDESDTCSAYRVSDGRRTMEVRFAVGCEDRQLPVALASMAGKYLRELFMSLLNRWWARQVPDLPPTGGYYEDGNRFYMQIESTARQMGVDQALLYRSR